MSHVPVGMTEYFSVNKNKRIQLDNIKKPKPKFCMFFFYDIEHYLVERPLTQKKHQLPNNV